jgi:hypothetical protein
MVLPRMLSVTRWDVLVTRWDVLVTRRGVRGMRFPSVRTRR